MMIYKFFFGRKGAISGDAAIVFSTLFCKSVYNHYNEQGMVAGNDFGEVIEYNCIDGEYYWSCSYDVASLAKEFGISRRGMYNILDSLLNNGYIEIDDEGIKTLYREDVVAGDYIKIPHGLNLRGWELVCYSYIRHRLEFHNKKTGDKYNNIIDTWVSRLQEELKYDDYKAFRNILLRIQRKGYIRLNKNNIIVNCNTNDIRENKKRSTKKGTPIAKIKKLISLSQGAYDYSLQR